MHILSSIDLNFASIVSTPRPITIRPEDLLVRATWHRYEPDGQCRVTPWADVTRRLSPEALAAAAAFLNLVAGGLADP